MRNKIALGVFPKGVPRFRDRPVHKKIGNPHQKADRQQHFLGSRPFADATRFITRRLPLQRDFDHRNDGVGKRQS